jgi:hypothetical protein
MIPEYRVIVDLTRIDDTCLANEFDPDAWSVDPHIIGVGGKE